MPKPNWKRLAVLGCHVLLESGFGPAMIFDIGGGSTELVLIESTETVPRILDWQSVPWGVVSLTESCGDEGASEDDRLRRYAHMRQLVRGDGAGQQLLAPALVQLRIVLGPLAVFRIQREALLDTKVYGRHRFG